MTVAEKKDPCSGGKFGARAGDYFFSKMNDITGLEMK